MCFYKVLSLAFISFLSSSVQAESVLTPRWVLREQYLSGEQVCQKYKEEVKKERSFRIAVPIDYNDPSKGKTSLYVHFERDYNPQLPTLAFFTGGPGETSHGSLTLSHLGINVLTFDQRGVACSRPQTYELYRDPAFYGSEKTAMDLEEIRRHLKIEKWTVMGVSYGTVPATIYAHLFPQRTRALVLEGVVLSASDELWTAPHRRKILQRFIKKQGLEFQKFIGEMIHEHGLPDFWFSLMARSYLGNNNGLEDLRRFIGRMRESASVRQSVVDLFHASLQPLQEISDPDNTVMAMVGCQELGLTSQGAIPYDRWTGTHLEPASFFSHKEICQAMGQTVRQAFVDRPYMAAHYPVEVPVTYFVGAMDGSTQAPLAVHHYKLVPRREAQLMIMPNGGHISNLETLYQVFSNPINKQYPIQEKLFLAAFMGQKIQQETLQHFNDVGPEKWASTAKNWPSP